MRIMADKVDERQTKSGLTDYFQFLRMTSWINIVIHTFALSFYAFLQVRFFMMAYTNYEYYREDITWKDLQAISLIANGMITSLFVVVTEGTLLMSFKIRDPKYIKAWRYYAILSMIFSLMFVVIRDTPIYEKLLCWILIGGLYLSAFNMASMLTEDMGPDPAVPDGQVDKKPLVLDA
ncbi:unnamed protein product [Allacma fusca]|uniref:Uncharacterized protein n=1 Tax=Allacma fusca TaxID=39272 RepID=A0A8J2Q1L7_9HEXA|nr:unnamed protein product [Allacma fusca]